MKFVLRTAPVLAALTVATTLHAADLNPRIYTKAPPAAPVFSWTGFYLSGGAGYGMWAASQRVYETGVHGPTDHTGGRGYFGAIGGGYDWQFSPSWVVGVFGDAQFGNIAGDMTLPGANFIGGVKNDLNAAAGARLGYLVAPNVLTYVNGGYSHAEFSRVNYTDLLGASTQFSTPRFSRDGWFVGGGFENSLNIFGVSAPGWFMKSEYRLAGYDRKDVPILGTADITLAVRPYVQTVSTSLVYRFDAQRIPAAASAPLYSKAPAYGSVNWTGLYLSGGGGYGMVTADSQAVILGAPVGLSQRTGGRGAFGTVGGGYDWQFSPSWVVGAFADAQFGDIGTTISLPGESGEARNNLNYAAGVRLGYLVSPNALSYINGGYSRAEFTGTTLARLGTGKPVGTAGKSQVDGWFIGGGLENSLNIFGISAPGWFMKTEYRLAEYNRNDLDLFELSRVPSAASIEFKPYVQTVSGSLVYRFNWGGSH